MAHGIIIELKAPVHVLPYRVLYGDTDKAGVVYYGTYMRLFEAGRTEYLRSLHGISYAGLEEKGIILPVTEAYCRYKSSARYDELLNIRTAVENVSRVSMRFNYHILHGRSERLVARGFTVHAAVNGNGKLVRLPEQLGRLMESPNQ